MAKPPVDRPGPETGGAAGVEPGKRVRLPARLTINEAGALRDVLAGWLAESPELALETRAIEAVDVAGMQLLIGLRRSAERAGKRVRLAEPPEGALLGALVGAGFRAAGDGPEPAAGQDGFWWGRS